MIVVDGVTRLVVVSQITSDLTIEWLTFNYKVFNTTI